MKKIVRNGMLSIMNAQISTAKKLKNFVSDEMKETAEAHIADLDAKALELRNMLDDLDKEEETKAEQIKELQNRILEIENAKKATESTLVIKNYLDSKKAVNDFLKVIQNSKSQGAMMSAWREKIMSISNDIDPDGVLLPTPVWTRIIDNLSKVGKIWPLLNHTGLMFEKITINKFDDPDAETARAGLHVKGSDKLKQEWNLVPKDLRPGAVFKMVALDYETIRTVHNPTALLNYVVDELSKGVVRECERAIIVGDGRDVANPRKIKSFETLAVTVDTPYITTVTQAGAIPTLAECASLADEIDSDGNLVFVAHRKVIAQIKTFLLAAGGTQMRLSDVQLAEQLGVNKVVDFSFMPRVAGTSETVMALVFDTNAYHTVGDNTPESIDMYSIEKNQHNYEAIGMFGGGLAELASAATLVGIGTQSPGDPPVTGSSATLTVEQIEAKIAVLEELKKPNSEQVEELAALYSDLENAKS